MPPTFANEPLAVSECRAAWSCTATGFAYATPLSGRRAVAAVGTLNARRAPVKARAEMSRILLDAAMTGGHDPSALLPLANRAAARAAVGAFDSLVLISTDGDGLTPSVAGIGTPQPMIVTSDHLSAPVSGWATLGAGWAVVLGSRGSVPGEEGDLLAAADVQAAMGLFAAPAPAPWGRTLLAVMFEPDPCLVS